MNSVCRWQRQGYGRCVLCTVAVTLDELRFGIELLSEGSARRVSWISGSRKRYVPCSISEFCQLQKTSCSDGGFCWKMGGRRDTRSRSPISALPLPPCTTGLTVVTRERSDFEKARVPVFNSWGTQSSRLSCVQCGVTMTTQGQGQNTGDKITGATQRIRK